jgi:hypothetical protein
MVRESTKYVSVRRDSVYVRKTGVFDSGYQILEEFAIPLHDSTAVVGNVE